MTERRITLRKMLEAALAFLALLALVFVYRAFSYVDTEEMLDVSVWIKTVSYVDVDHVGDSVWSYGSGSGFLVSRDRCEVWTNEHVVKNAAIVEVFPRDWPSVSSIQGTVTGATSRCESRQGESLTWT